jgi:hypothetical protein
LQAPHRVRQRLCQSMYRHHQSDLRLLVRAWHRRSARLAFPAR